MLTNSPENSLLPYVQQFQSALGFSILEDQKLFQLAQSIDSRLAQNQVLYEFSIGSEHLEIDLACWLPSACNMIEICSKSDIPPQWERMLNAHFHVEHEENWPGWKGIWLEFDSHGSMQNRPNIFFTFSGRELNSAAFARRLVSLVEKYVGMSVSIQRNIEKLITHAPFLNIVQIGFLLPRGMGDRVKVCLLNVSENEVEFLQELLQFSVSPHVKDLWKIIIQEKAHWVLALDLFPDQEIRSAFEIQPVQKPFSAQYSWLPLLDHLSISKSPHINLDIVHGHVQTGIGASQWPPDIKREWQQRPEIVDSLMLTSLNHVKLYDAGHGESILKYYYLQQPVLKTREGKYERPGPYL